MPAPGNRPAPEHEPQREAHDHPGDRGEQPHLLEHLVAESVARNWVAGQEELIAGVAIRQHFSNPHSDLSPLADGSSGT
jgi:hypothetical protein